MNQLTEQEDKFIYFTSVDMLREVTCGRAMGNASDEVKKNSNYVTDTVSNDGVAVGIMERIIKN